MTSEVNQRRGIPPHITVIEYGTDGRIVGGRWIIEKSACEPPAAEPQPPLLASAQPPDFINRPGCPRPR